MKTTAIVLMIIGLLSALSGVLWQFLFPTPDANIGAGLLVVLGLPLAGAGALLALASTLLRRRGRQAGRT